MRSAAMIFCASIAACASSGSAPSIQQPAAIPVPVQVATSAPTTGASGAVTGIGAFHVSSNDRAVQTTIEAPIDQVWAVMKSVYDSLSIPVSTLNAQQHVIGNSSFRARRHLGKTPMIQLIDCGSFQGGPSAETYDINFSITTQLVPLDARSTTLATLVQALGSAPSFSGNPINCGSMGKLEANIADEVRKRLR